MRIPFEKNTDNSASETIRLLSDNNCIAEEQQKHQATTIEDQIISRPISISISTAAAAAVAATMEKATVPSPSQKTFVTQQTFDSTDDLLVSDSDDDTNGNEEQQQQRPPVATINSTNSRRSSSSSSRRPHPPKSLWDCQAFCWPPRAPTSIVQAGWKYVKNPYHFMEVIVLAIFLLVCYLSPDYLVEAHQRPIPFQTTNTGDALIDLTFANPYHHNETIPGSLLDLLTVWLPMTLFWSLGNFFGPRGDFHATLCMFLLAMAMKIFVVACIKNYAGYLRPSFYDMCHFNADTVQCDDETTSARESFPSGHAATALSSMTLVSLFLLGKVRGAMRQRGVSAKAAIAVSRTNEDAVDDALWMPSLIEKPLALLAVSPMFLGMFIASSRVRDNWHHPADVLCGGVIGIGCAMFAHGLWYPSTYSYYAGIPLATVKKILIERRARAKSMVPSIDLEASDVHV